MQPPTVELGSNVTGGAAALSVKFTATGNDPDGEEEDLLYAWDFGDGSMGSFEQNPTHTYVAKGTYTAKVTVSDGSGATASKTVVITVTDTPGNAAPVIDGIGKLSPHGNPMQLQLTVQAHDPENDKLTFTWDFDDQTSATGADVTHTWTTAGTYNVKVTASDGKGGTATRTETVTVSPAANVLPTVTIAADPTQGSAPLPVQFSANPDDPDGDRRNLLYVWAFGDGSFSAEQNPLHTYTLPGVHTATLTVTDARGGKTTKSVQITVSSVQGGPAPAPKGPDAAPTQAPWFGVSEPVKTSVAGFAKSGLSVKVTATEAMTGSAKLVVSSKVAKALGLKSTTLATASVKFTSAGSKTVKFKVSKTVKKALAKAKGSVKVTLAVSLKAQGESAKSSTRSVTLTRR
ncbi:PKD domain-containing protein [Solirubrobacter phytolaccae]|uniref:PKD domain-containing protein n=1 Tax=Solirubrobacter phytolaccae TaxID=1404360 RepID=A0A9X3S7Q5_9ACTN|nr:PKD domain-containing protein [Solirubrobacter phytolaccae]